MYYQSREAAGQLLASQMYRKYRHEPCAVLALNDGGVVVGLQLALKLRCPITMLITRDITLPMERQALAGISHDGAFSYNHSLSSGEIEEMVMEQHNFIEQEKMRRLNEMHRQSGNGLLIKRELLDDHHVIIISDGLFDTFSIDLAMEYLKPIRTKSIVMATPFASVNVVDRMHVLADDLYCANVLTDYFDIDHYYDQPAVPAHEAIIAAVEKIVAYWQQ